jgi:hypothetical protein
MPVLHKVRGKWTWDDGDLLPDQMRLPALTEDELGDMWDTVPESGPDRDDFEDEAAHEAALLAWREADDEVYSLQFRGSRRSTNRHPRRPQAGRLNQGAMIRVSLRCPLDSSGIAAILVK